mmetsp:Transcript_1099/g.1890  ORF Transcript_1099/g.1890 Transcript_1099/m.1890 type:complete len:501 (+) Transcript_1099:61-1563(+)
MALHDPPSHDHPPHPHNQVCTHITPIPLPADDCDRTHSMHAALSSLHAATSSFDAAMDSLLATTAYHRRRVRDLERRMARFRECLRRLDDVASSKPKDGEFDDGVVMVFCPGSYESALEGMESELATVREALDSSHDREREKGPVSSNGIPASNSAARAAADAAVRNALQSDVRMDNGQAVPSDAWLDHASMGLGVGRALAATDEQRSVPLLLGEDVGRGEAEYRRILDAMAIHASAKRDGFDRLEGLDEPGGGGIGGRGDDESVYSITSQMSAISVASSTRMTAGQRRRWHKQQQMRSMKAAGRSKSQVNPAAMLSPHPEIPSSSSQGTGTTTAMSAVAGRQQSLVGSHPYLCEVFHDSYGIGPEPARGLVDCSGFSSRCSREGGTEFYPPSSHVTDLLVFNTTRNSYGLAKSAASVAASAQSKSAKGTGEEGGGRPGAGAGISNSPVPVARKSQSSGGGNGVNKPSLANLVFKADATEAKAAGPSLDLPATLPHELAA